ncbi:hypothetical protein AMJ83_04910 [candidate division WOR_3 bacterium SM23_42]|uniref:GWxTD domain-containing protein n=1 Tax=candidate division WOR_3 bacterium SM23_42 TaxID=1703779 RepID=A0A0S8FST7_UNCW3|nr:MAG: hypothetical protein AMJ83_04910 [candidate division WOR_3 bacterium SM23_42]
MKIKKYRFLLVFVALIVTYCAVNVLAAPYYRLLENERVKYLGLKGIDSVAADQYMNMESTKERTAFYENYWLGNDDERALFEERSAFAFRQFGRVAPVSDDRIQVYVKYGEARREVITPEKKVGVSSSVVVHPAEIWTYKSEGLVFDFVRMARAYELISQSEFGDRVVIPYLREIASDTVVNIEAKEPLDFLLSYGRFRQQKNLTRLELYLSMQIEDTTGMSFFRDIKVYNRSDSLVSHTRHILAPEDGEAGVFVDESNLWLKPEEYRVEVELVDIENKRRGSKELSVNLIEYQDDAKEISDLIPAQLIDMSFTHEKFDKPVGRVIPTLQHVLPVHRLFYLYSEAYNLETSNGMYRIRTTYEVYNKEQMRQEVVDVMIKDWIEPGNIAYIGTEYHPMDLSPGNYIIVSKVKDLISGKERSAVSEFRLVGTD